MAQHLQGPERAQAVRGMFTRIARQYDLMNRLMTAGMDLRWRKEVIRRAHLRPHSRLLDLGTGTGDLAREALQQEPTSQVVAADFTLEMMRVGLQRHSQPQQWCDADALHLPFPDQTFDAVVSGFLLRNVIDLDTALKEQVRVLRPQGWIVALDTTRPQENFLSPFVRFYMKRIIPLLGRLIAMAPDAYTYLPETSTAFLSAEALQARFEQAGLTHAGFRRLNFGTVAIHWGQKPA
ncbi:MAG: ubiquinone/menaquinone biosynthesis methyltransferase [Anaerolinea sp.]